MEAAAANESNANINNSTLNNTRSVDIQTASQQDDISEGRQDEKYFVAEEDEEPEDKFAMLHHRYNSGNLISSVDEEPAAIAAASQSNQRIQIQQQSQFAAQPQLKPPPAHYTSVESSYAGSQSIAELPTSKELFEAMQQQSNQVQQEQQQQQQQQQQQSDKKVWAVSGKMPGSVSKKFMRDYKIGRYKKILSLKGDMDYLNSPHHEQKHLGNTIFPFQNNTKNRVHLQGSFDYRKFQNSSEGLNSAIRPSSLLKRSTVYNSGTATVQSTKPDRIYSPHTTSRQVMRGNTHSNGKNINEDNQQQQQMEIRYIDIISQPLIKPIRFIDNRMCAHSMTNLRHTAKKSFFIQPEASHYDWKKKQQLLDEQREALAARQSQYGLQPNESNIFLTNANHSRMNSSVQPKNICLEPDGFVEANFGKTVYKQKRMKQSESQSQFRSTPTRLPAFAAIPENITFFSKAKANLVKYVNDIGVKENPLTNTFVSQRKFF